MLRSGSPGAASRRCQLAASFCPYPKRENCRGGFYVKINDAKGQQAFEGAYNPGGDPLLLRRLRHIALTT